jgi:integrase
MGRRSRSDVPRYRLHSASGQAVVTLSGRDHYLGRHGSPESHAEYARLIAVWQRCGGRIPVAQDATVSELVLRFLRWAESYYRNPQGIPTKEVTNLKLAMRPLVRLFGRTLAYEFGPLALKAIQGDLIQSGVSRAEINRRVQKVKRCFRWGVENELIPPTTWHGLQAVTGLKLGRTEAKERPPVRPVDDATVEATIPNLLPPVAAMVRLQRLTGMRPGEVCSMRTCDIDRTGAVWLYRPETHKNAYRAHDRVIPLGPLAQALLTPWIERRADAPERHLFSPADAMQDRYAAIRAARKTRVQPSQQSRAKPDPERKRGQSYTVQSYGRAIARAAAAAGVSHWHPHQLRHAKATELRREVGLEAAQTVLGHRSADVTTRYAQRDLEQAVAAALKLG